MDALKLHLLMNYYPAIGLIAGTLLLLFGYFIKSDRVKKACMKIFVLLAFFTLPAFVTGEIAAGKSAEAYRGMRGESLQKHKNIARPAFLAVGATGLAAFISLVLFRRESELVRWGLLAVLILSLISCVLIVRATWLGRQIKWAAAPAFEKQMETEPERKFETKQTERKILWLA